MEISQSDEIIIPPFFGEFGVMIMEHVRYVHTLTAQRKIVCCEAGQECLFPSASEYFTDYVNPVEDANRIHRGPARLRQEYLLAVDDLYRRITDRYPGVPIHSPEYPARQQLCRNVKFRPTAGAVLRAVDIVVCPRRRAVSTVKNWSHWEETVRRFRVDGFTVGIAGNADTSMALEADEYAWNHPAGATQGAVDLLSHCRLFVGSDTGVAHLAALIDTPQIVFGFWDEQNPNCTNFMQISNRRFCQVLQGAWNDPEKVAQAAVAYLT